MSFKERFSNFAVNDEGDIVPLEDIPTSEYPPSNAFRAQGMANLEQLRYEQVLIDEAEYQQKLQREQAIAVAALKNAGVYISFEEHFQNQVELVKIASDISMYRGGESGGYSSKDFRSRYEPQATSIEKGARTNHMKRVSQDLPRIYKAAELESAGFSSYDIQDDLVQMRSELMSRYGGPANKKARAKRRADLNNNINR